MLGRAVCTACWAFVGPSACAHMPKNTRLCACAGLLDGGLKFRPMCMPDRFIEHGDYRDQLNLAGLTPGHIAGTALQVSARCAPADRGWVRACWVEGWRGRGRGIPFPGRLWCGGAQARFGDVAWGKAPS